MWSFYSFTCYHLIVSEVFPMKKTMTFAFVISAFFALTLSGCGGSSAPTPKDYGVLESIHITKEARQLDYALNETANYEGLEVTASFSKGEEKVVAHKDLVFSGFNSSSAGDKTINIEYTYKDVSKSTSYKVTVYDSTDVTLDFYAFNDTHGKVRDNAESVGIAKTSTFIKNVSENKHSLLISSGDMWQGSLESNSNRGELMTSWMEYLNFTSMTLGNHEFDWGVNSIKSISKKYNLPILGINIVDKKTQKRADYVQPSTIVYRGGAKIGIIGAIGDCYSSISYSQVMDVEFVLDKPMSSNKPLSDLIKAESTRLRNEEKCDFIVYTFHGDSSNGDTYYNPELSRDGYVDVVLEGHTHVERHYQDDNNVWHFQGQADGYVAINHFTVNLNTVTDEYTLSFNENLDVYNMKDDDKYNLEEDAGTNALINKYDFSEYYKSLGNNSVNRYRDELRQLSADLYFDKGTTKWKNYASKVVFGGGYTSIRSDGVLPAGPVTYAKLYELFPFDNDVILTQVDGYVLKNNFINNTNPNYFLKYSSYGLDLKQNQNKINDSSMYYIIIDRYSFDYLLSHSIEPVEVAIYDPNGFYARDFFAEYARNGGFSDGSIDDLLPSVDIVNNGSLDYPYSISEAYTVAKINGSNTVWGYFRGTVKQKADGINSKNALTNIVFEDPARTDYTMKMIALHKYDDDLTRGFKSVDEMPVGTNAVMYGGFKLYDGVPGFSSVNMVIYINNFETIAGNSIDDPISVFNYTQLFNSLYGQEKYVFGVIDNLVTSDDNQTINSFAIRGTHTVDFAYPSPYYRQIEFSSTYEEAPDNISYASDIPVGDLVSGETNIIVKIYENNVEIVWSDAGTAPKIQHAGTLEDPYTVSDALIHAKRYSSIGESPYVYCTGVVASVGKHSLDSGDLGNVYIEDPTTHEQILIYWLHRYEGATAEDGFESIDSLKVGDELLICGQPFNYNGTTLEFGYTTYCITINGVEQKASA